MQMPLTRWHRNVFDARGRQRILVLVLLDLVVALGLERIVAASLVRGRRLDARDRRLRPREAGRGEAGCGPRRGCCGRGCAVRLAPVLDDRVRLALEQKAFSDSFTIFTHQKQFRKQVVFLF